jgi:hypothetical protein
MLKIDPISEAISKIEELSNTLNIPSGSDVPTSYECFVFWNIQSPIADRYQTRKTLKDDQLAA